MQWTNTAQLGWGNLKRKVKSRLGEVTVWCGIWQTIPSHTFSVWHCRAEWPMRQKTFSACQLSLPLNMRLCLESVVQG